MFNSKAAGLVNVLEESEKSAFRKYLACDFFTGNAQLGKLFSFLADRTGSETEETKLRRSAFRFCFPGRHYNDKKLRYLMTELCGHLENFLTLQSIRRDPEKSENILSKELAVRGAEKAYNSLLHNHRLIEQRSARRDADFYLYRYTGEFHHLAYASATLKRDDKSNIEDTVNYLDRFYLARKLQLCCEIFNVRNVLSVDYKVFLLDEILHHLENRSYEDTPVIRIYYRILMTLLESEKEEHFDSLRELLLAHGAAFSLPELREMYQYVLNYCIKKINTGHMQYQRTLFEIYKVILENKVLLSEGHLSQWDYKNIVTISLRQQEFDWTQQFIQRYKSELPSRERENAFVYNMAFLHFHRGEYSQTLQLLQKVEFTDLYYQLDSRVILLKIYFELDDTETFFYHTAAFKTFLKRNKLISDYQRAIYLNLVKFTSRLLRAGTSRRKIALVKKLAEENRQVADLAWLLKKVEEREA
ncbi:MAG: hypothetical protein FD123_2145 [Bacteroidetes bacterium]|nr:MAG: hypothetical protein FD123_2145 [Bacteroidota bacterium]